MRAAETNLNGHELMKRQINKGRQGKKELGMYMQKKKVFKRSYE